MTVIAYRDGVMAADGLLVFDDDYKRPSIKRENCPKIIKRQGYLVGVAGLNCPSDGDFIEWFFNDLGDIQLPSFKPFKFTALVVTPAGDMQMWDETGACFPLDCEFFAVGAGQEYALGAMAAGASAREAVKIAVKWHPQCGGRISTKRLARTV